CSDRLAYQSQSGVSSSAPAPLRLARRLRTAPCFRGGTGGVYEAQGHVQRGVADSRLLAIPTSCRRVAACNLHWTAYSKKIPSASLRLPRGYIFAIRSTQEFQQGRNMFAF